MTTWMVQAPGQRSTLAQAHQSDTGGQASTFCVCPVGVHVWYNGLIAHLLKRLEWLVVDLEDTARSPPAADGAPVGHVEKAAAGGFCAGVVGLGRWGKTA